jgi:hypothetical protein
MPSNCPAQSECRLPLYLNNDLSQAADPTSSADALAGHRAGTILCKEKVLETVSNDVDLHQTFNVQNLATNQQHAACSPHRAYLEQVACACTKILNSSQLQCLLESRVVSAAISANVQASVSMPITQQEANTNQQSTATSWLSASLGGTAR